MAAPTPAGYRAVVIDRVEPVVDCGRYPIKREVGDELVVEADLFREGHDLLAAFLLYRGPGESDWRRARFELVENDRWRATTKLEQLGRWRYTAEALPDEFGSWVADLKKRAAAGQELSGELLEGRRILERAAARATEADQAMLLAGGARLTGADSSAAYETAIDPALEALALRYADPALATRFERELEVVVDRERARFAAWYEIFPRSQGTDPSRGATFREAAARLPAIAAMGFDVLYMTPIHPIGRTNRKGPNNTLVAGPNDPGSPYAIGGEAGGHTAVEPSLGRLEDFDWFQREVRRHGLELAMDFAIQASPDHPWVREHPQWFYHRADGSIRFAENPPKKYEDIYPLNFHCAEWRALWQALREVLQFWIERGVRIFRVDNPHTKPLDFWEWLIASLKAEYPDVVFLSEAFTRPKIMRALAKAGFSQSYTYFTWRSEKQELIDYLTEITSPPVSEYFRGNLFANTPDILSELLRHGGRPAFEMRLVLAATLSSVYGIYNGFELCENRSRGDTEYYQDSEMYQLKVWDWDRPGNIVELVRQVNQIRRQHPALQEYDNLRFFRSDDPYLLCYGKRSADGADTTIMVVNLDPYAAHDGLVRVPFWEWGMEHDEPYEVHDLLSGAVWRWQGETNWVRLDPAECPAHIFWVTRPGGEPLVRPVEQAHEVAVPDFPFVSG